MTSTTLLNNALIAYRQGKRNEVAAIIETFCSLCVTKGRFRKCERCGLQRAINLLKEGK